MLGIVALAATSAVPARVAAEPPGFPVAGLLRVTPHTHQGWGWSGAWRYPVGDARDYSLPGPKGEPGYRLLRTIGGPEERTRLHQGADLGCGHGGGPVRAAASGLVMMADRSGWNSGYGHYVVLGHRLPGGRIAYSVYAHLADGSITVRAGQMVAAGQRLGRVGRTGRATSSHLHFEIRVAETGEQRWENESVVDPLEFVAARLAAPCAPDTLGRYLEWAQYAGLVEGSPAPDAALRYGAWWRMLAVASRLELAVLPPDPSALAESLQVHGILAAPARNAAGDELKWAEVARDLERIRERGLRLPARPIEDREHRAACERRLGQREPTLEIARTLGGQSEPPSFASVVLAVADLAPAFEPPKPPRPRKRATASKPAAPGTDSSRAAPKRGP